MTDLEELKEFRRILVIRRQQCARNAVDSHVSNREVTGDDAAGSNYGPEFQRIQEQIEAVDRAIGEADRG